MKPTYSKTYLVTVEVTLEGYGDSEPFALDAGGAVRHAIQGLVGYKSLENDGDVRVVDVATCGTNLLRNNLRKENK